MGIQVDLLTRGKTAHEKEFIDFEFDGRHISEFGLVAVFGGGRHSLNAIPEFEDETTEVEGLGGQYFWGSRYKAKTRTFTLHTDGMTEAQLDDFKKHFQPGKYGKFIEDKLACRYGWARLSQGVTFNVVPFKTTIQLLGRDVEVNEYKGEGTINFVFDDPFSYSTINYIRKDTGPLNDEELRMIYLNNIPFDARNEKGQAIEASWKRPTLRYKYPLSVGMGKSAISADATGVTWAANDNISNKWHYYNPSNVNTKAKLSISLEYSFTSKDIISDELVPIYFNEVADSINGEGYNLISSYKLEYNSNGQEVITEKGEFRYTSANVVNQINRAIQIAKDFYIYHNAAGTWNVVELEETLRREIINTKVMAWTASVLRIMMTKDEFYNADTGCFLKDGTIAVNLLPITGGANGSALNWFYYFNIFMLCMLANCSSTQSYHLENDAYSFGTAWTYKIVFDGINSETFIKYNYNSIVSQELTKISGWEEKSGEMMCSPYLKLDGGDTLNENGGYHTCHYLTFKKSNGATVSPVSAALEYTYTYL